MIERTNTQKHEITPDEDKGKFSARVPKSVIKAAKIKAVERGETFEALAEQWLRAYVGEKEQKPERTKVQNNYLTPDALAALQAVNRGFQSLMAQIETKDRP